MTNHWNDLKNADVILVMGANPASNHPISMKWMTRARERGAKLVCVDPRFTQTAAVADLYAPLRSGTDIAFLGGMIHYILERNLFFREYVVNYTDAPFLVHADFKMPGELDGVFSGYNEKETKYDRKTWAFQLDEKGVPKKDPTLKDPNCVFQLLKKHYSRYTVEKVSQVTGTPKEKLEEVYETIGSTGKPDRAATGCYAMGWTQHTVGVQNIRAFTIVQLLLGNMGMAGGGVNAMRGEGNVQGSTDHAILFHILPGYLPTPSASLVSLKDYTGKYTPTTKEPKSVNWWGNRGKYITSYLKALYGDHATKENDFAYSWLPKLDEGMQASWLPMFVQMYRGAFEGFFAWGMNPACSSPGAGKAREALGKLKWMVNVNLYDNETASFWRGPGMKPEEDQDGGLPVAVLFLRREGREHLELRPSRAVEIQGDRAARAVDARRGDHERALLPGEEALPEGERGLPRSDRESHVGVRGEGPAGEGEAPRHSQGRDGDQRVLPRRRVRPEGDPPEAHRQEREPGAELREPAGRRIHVERELALQRELHHERRKGRQHDGPQGEGRPDRPRALSELGVGMAGEPEGPLQPRLRRLERESVGPEPPGTQMEPGGPRCRETGRVGRRRPRRPGTSLWGTREGNSPSS